MSAITICLIDDDSVYQFITKNTILKFNSEIKISSYKNGEEAILAFKKMLESNMPLPDIILLDINMPIMDGWQFLDEYVTIKPQITSPVHIYMISSSLDVRDTSRAKGYADVKDFIHKPIDSKMMSKITQHLLNRP